MELEFFTRTHLGQERRYILDKKKRMWIQTLTKRVTVTDDHALALQGLGFNFIEVDDPEPKLKFEVVDEII